MYVRASIAANTTRQKRLPCETKYYRAWPSRTVARIIYCTSSSGNKSLPENRTVAHKFIAPHSERNFRGCSGHFSASLSVACTRQCKSSTRSCLPQQHNDFGPWHGAKYCDEYVCLSVCLSARISRKPHIRTIPIVYMLSILYGMQWLCMHGPGGQLKRSKVKVTRLLKPSRSHILRPLCYFCLRRSARRMTVQVSVLQMHAIHC